MRPLAYPPALGLAAAQLWAAHLRVQPKQSWGQQTQRPVVLALWVGHLHREAVGPLAGRPHPEEAGLWAGHLRQRAQAKQFLAQRWAAVGLWAAGQRLAWAALPIRVGLA